MYKKPYKKGPLMIAANYSTLREHLKSYLDCVVDNFETLIVTRKGDKRNVVILSEENYNNLLENQYLRSEKANHEWLLESVKQYEEGKVRSVSIDG